LNFGYQKFVVDWRQEIFQKLQILVASIVTNSASQANKSYLSYYQLTNETIIPKLWT